MTDYLPTDFMDETEFEEFCFRFLRELGFVNLDWRKGTGHRSSPSDSGRDIVAELPKEDVGGRKYRETWFVDCKHQTSGVPPTKVQPLLSWAEAERADVALVIASNYLSNPCKDFLKTYETNNRPRFRIRYWERPDLHDMLEGRQDFINRHLRTHMRTEPEILKAEHEYMMRVWYDRKLVLEQKLAEGKEMNIKPEILEGMRRGMRKMEEEHGGAENLVVEDAFEWGMINGKLSALRWVLGEDWDELYT